MTKSQPKKTSKTRRSAKPRITPGPKPDILKIEGDWQEAMRKSLQKKKPANGWPK